jgi:hypothetical protein
MKRLFAYLGVIAGITLASGSLSYAGFGNGNIPSEMIKEVLFHLDDQNLQIKGARIDHECRDFAVEVCHERLKARASAKVAKIEAILGKFGKFIQLPSGDEISPIAPTQELWVEVMGVNPSWFSEHRFCPESYKTVVIHGRTL